MIKIVVLVLCFSLCLAGPSLRIVGGIPAKSGQFTFSAGLTVFTAAGSFFCGGTLISSQWVLTAGQCVNGARTVSVRLGSLARTGNDLNAVTQTSNTVYVHPEFNSTTLEHDIGAIYLQKAVSTTDTIEPINYVASSSLPDSSIVATLGWGETSDSDGSLSSELIYTFMTTMSNLECRIYYGNQIGDNMVCVGGTFNEGTCLGDSGAPLIQYSANGYIYVVGVSSFYSGNGCDTTDPSGYTRVSAYRDWIKNITGV